MSFSEDIKDEGEGELPPTVVSEEVHDRVERFVRRFNYVVNLTREERWNALDRAVKELGVVTVLNILNEYYDIVNSESAKDILEEDMEYVQLRGLG